jgi:hypothetical protein
MNGCGLRAVPVPGAAIHKQKVAGIRKLFRTCLVKLRPGMSVEEATLSIRTEFDTDDNGVIDRAEFGGVISKVLALRLPGYVEELLWMDFCGHETFASWVGDETETAEEPDHRPCTAQPGAVHCWGERGSDVQSGLKARPAAASGRPRPRPRAERPPPRPPVVLPPLNMPAAVQLTDPLQNGSVCLEAPRGSPNRAWPASTPMPTRRLNTWGRDTCLVPAEGRGAPSCPPTTVNLTASAAQLTDPLQSGSGHRLPAPALASASSSMPPATPLMRTRRLNLDTANPNSGHLPGADINNWRQTRLRCTHAAERGGGAASAADSGARLCHFDNPQLGALLLE